MSGDLILVTGASGQIGISITKELLRNGFRVVAATRDPDRVRSSQSLPTEVELVAADLSSEADVTNLCGELAEKSDLTGLVHAARDRGNLSGPDPSEKEWLSEYWLATVVPFRIATALAKTNSLRSVVALGSIYGLGAQRPDLYESKQSLNPHYGASRAAVIQMVKDLAVRLAPRTRVNCISFGGVQGRAEDDFGRRYSEHAPAGRMLEAGDLGGPVCFLLSDDSSGMTGHNLVVDGGWTSW